MKYLKELEALRGFLALWVVFGHVASAAAIRSRLFEAKFFNKEAVIVFVILSGFAIAAMLDSKKERYVPFLSRRFLRIFPTYLLFLAISVALAPLAVDVWQNAPDGSMKLERIRIAEDTMYYWWPHLMAHLVGLQGIIPPAKLPSTDYTFIGQAWSISLEWQFYILAPFVIGLLAPSRKAVTFAVAAVGFFLLLAVTPVMPEGFIGRWMPQFAVGIGTYYGLKHRDLVPHQWHLPVWLFAIGVILATASISAIPYLVWVVSIGIAVLPEQRLLWPLDWARRVMNSRLLQYFGKISYSVYLSHMIVLVIVLWGLEGRGPEQPWPFFILVLVLTFAGTLLLATVSYFVVEKPFHEMGRRLRFSRGSEAAA